MAEYEQSRTIDARATEVFDFVSRVENLPKYMPTTQDAESQGEERVRVQGEAAGHPYDSEGYFRVAEEGRRLEWGSDAHEEYWGWLTVADQGGSAAEVTIHLSFPPESAQGGDIDADSGDLGEVVGHGLDASLDSIESQTVEGAGKVEPPEAT